MGIASIICYVAIRYSFKLGTPPTPYYDVYPVLVPQCIFISQPTLSECIRSPNSSRKQGFLVAHSEPFRGQLKVEHKCVVCIVCAPDRQFSTSECTEYSVPYVWLLFFSVLSALGPSRRTGASIAATCHI